MRIDSVRVNLPIEIQLEDLQINLNLLQNIVADQIKVPSIINARVAFMKNRLHFMEQFLIILVLLGIL